MSNRERLLRTIVRLYPSSGGGSPHEEVISTARDTLASEGRAGAVRELADLAVHAFRARTGLDATSSPGAVAATAAPLAQASAIALSGIFLLFAEWAWYSFPITFPEFRTSLGPFSTLGPIAYVAWLLVLPAAAWWPRAVRPLTALALGLTVALVPLSAVTGTDRPPLFVLSALALFGAMALAAPADPLRRPSAGRVLLVTGALAVFGYLALSMISAEASTYGEVTRPLWYRYAGDIRNIGFAVPAALVIALLVSLACLRRSRRIPFAIVVLTLPWGVFAYGATAGPPLGRLHAITVCAAGVIVLGLLMALIRVAYNARRGTVRADGTG
ncbi:hypothetical protein ACFY4C_33710 [Actinomadura viridis]|uniref:hypothetical protein n=1 Tax=Actinomadura viridis TaxID=58110 RepID=UPI0036AB45FE